LRARRVALAATPRAVLGVGEVLIVDWDVHHGNGTQDILRGWKRLFRTHQSPLVSWDRTRGRGRKGAGQGTTLNCPLPAMSVGRKCWRLRISTYPADEVSSGLVLISAGFDSTRAIRAVSR
jgi:acetoin utilization deacetylase AcuC-like enzyme